MKILIFIITFLVSISVFALNPKDLKCSRAGSDILLVNGIGWKDKEVVRSILEDDIVPYIPPNYLDSKLPQGKYTKFKFSYNNTSGFVKDILESASQKISQNFDISLDNAFVAAYYFTYKGVITVGYVEKLFNTRSFSFTDLSNFLYSYFTSNTIDKIIKDAYSLNISDTKDLKNSISSTLLSGKKLILITESQGNFFGKQAILDFQNGESLNFNGKTGLLNDYIKTIGQVQIAPPTGPILPKNKLVLNDKDLINVIFFEKPESNFILIPPDPDLRSQRIDRYANHFITSTYLNSENMTTGNLTQLKKFHSAVCCQRSKLA